MKYTTQISMRRLGRLNWAYTGRRAPFVRFPLIRCVQRILRKAHAH